MNDYWQGAIEAKITALKEHLDRRLDAKMESARKDPMSDWKELFQALERIEGKLNAVLKKELQIMALGQDIIDAVTAESTVIDSFIALVQGWISSGTVTAAEGARILADINNNKSKLEAAILANTPPPPTP